MAGLCLLLAGSIAAQPASLLLDFEPGGEEGEAVAWEGRGDVLWAEGFRGRSPRFTRSDDAVRLEWGDWLNLERGSLRFRFRPDWEPGRGPGHHASLLSIGKWTAGEDRIGYWSLGVGPDGKRIHFSGQSPRGGDTFLAATVGFMPGAWHDLLLVYSPQASWLYLNGRRFGPGKGVSAVPPESVCREYGVFLGNSHGGNEAIGGSIDCLEVLGDRVTGFVQRRDARLLHAEADPRSPSVRLSWDAGTGVPQEIWRRRSGEARWARLDTVVARNDYVDRSPRLERGVRYEYLAGMRRTVVSTGVLPPRERRGRALLLVEKDLHSRIEEDLREFRADLQGDGWTVEEWQAPSHDFRPVSRYRERCRAVRERIRAFHREDPDSLNVALLIGNVVIPYSGDIAEDGHQTESDDHRGAWPCDAWFGDLDGTWTDTTVSRDNRTHAIASNKPGDGKFDQDYLPSPLEVAIGRIDFSGLRGLEGVLSRFRNARAVEAAMLRSYLSRNHDYRMGRTHFSRRALVGNHLPPHHSIQAERRALDILGPLFGNRGSLITRGDCFGLDTPVLTGFLAGAGGRSSLASGRFRSGLMDRKETAPRAAFLFLYGSWIGDWNLEESFLKASLAGESSSLAVMSVVRIPWNLSAMALGAPLAQSYLDTANGASVPVPRSLAVLGDITLRLRMIPPPRDLAARRVDAGVRLSWTLPRSPAGALVYRSASQDGPYRRISGSVPLVVNRFTDAAPDPAEPWYGVRLIVRENSPSRGYDNLGQRAIVRVVD